VKEKHTLDSAEVQNDREISKSFPKSMNLCGICPHAVTLKPAISVMLPAAQDF
jgi:hypothetical protein